MRIEKVDKLKGIAIVLVVLGHAIQHTTEDFLQTSYIAKLIYCFHMPLFMWLSGYVARIKGERVVDGLRWIGKQFISLVLPIIVWEYILAGYFHRIHSVEAVINILHAWILNPTGGYWFLWTLFLCDVLFLILFTISRGFNRKWRGGTELTFAGIEVITVFALSHAFAISWGNIGNLYLYYFFFCLGHFIGRRNQATGGVFAEDELSVISDRIMAAVSGHRTLVSVLLALCYFGGAVIYTGGQDINIRGSVLLSIVLSLIYRFVIASIGIVFLWMITDYIKGFLGRTLTFVGRYTKEIYILQGMMISFLGRIIRRMYWGKWENIIVITVLSLAGSLVIPLAIERGVIELLFFGKRKVSILTSSKN